MQYEDSSHGAALCLSLNSATMACIKDLVQLQRSVLTCGLVISSAPYFQDTARLAPRLGDDTFQQQLVGRACLLVDGASCCDAALC
jgi:hypothetical protein